MTNVTDRRPFSELGDQQLLDRTKRLAANQRCLEVHILDHLDEIDRRGLALLRGFSSLFDYTVRELGFSEAAAQRRIRTMRLCRRHGWVRAVLRSGELNLTAAAQLESAFAGAERKCRQPASQDEAGEPAESVLPGRPAQVEQYSGDEAAVETPAVLPAAAGRRDRGAATPSAPPQSVPGSRSPAEKSSGDEAAVEALVELPDAAGRRDLGAVTPSALPQSVPGSRSPAEKSSGDEAAVEALVELPDAAGRRDLGAATPSALPESVPGSPAPAERLFGAGAALETGQALPPATARRDAGAVTPSARSQSAPGSPFQAERRGGDRAAIETPALLPVDCGS